MRPRNTRSTPNTWPRNTRSTRNTWRTRNTAGRGFCDSTSVLLFRTRGQLDRARGFARVQHRHQIRERQRLELARQEVADLEGAEFFPQQDLELRAHVLRQRRAGRGAPAAAP